MTVRSTSLAQAMAFLQRAGVLYGPALALAVLVTINALVTPRFATAGTFWTILLQAAPSVLVGVGMTIVIATRGVDLSVGSVMAVASAVSAVMIDFGALVA